MSISVRSDADMGDLQSLCVAELFRVDQLGLINPIQEAATFTMLFPFNWHISF